MRFEGLIKYIITLSRGIPDLAGRYAADARARLGPRIPAVSPMARPLLRDRWRRGFRARGYSMSSPMLQI